MGHVNVEIDDELHRQVRSVAALSGRKLYEVVEHALRAEVARFETQRAKQRP